MHYFADGLYETEHIEDIDDCDTQWWKNMLYVNNLFVDKPKRVRINILLKINRIRDEKEKTLFKQKQDNMTNIRSTQRFIL